MSEPAARVVPAGAPAPAAVAGAGLAALAVAMGIGRFAFTPLLPMMQEDAGVSLAAGAWLAAANYAGYLAGALAAVVLRPPPGAAARWGLVAIALATAAMGLAGGFAAWLALRAVAGVASALVLVFGAAWCLERLAGSGRSALGGLVFAGVGVGIALAGLAAIALMAAGAGSRPAWLALGALSLAVAAALWPLLSDAPRAAPRPALRPLAWDFDTLRLVLCYGAMGLGYIIPATFLPVMAKQAVADPALFGWAWPLFGAAAAASTVLVARAPWSNRRLWIAASLVMALGVALPALLPGLAPTLLAGLAVGGTFMVITMAGLQEGRRVGGARATSLMAAMTAAFALGQIAGPLLAGYASAGTLGFGGALLLAAALLLASAAGLAYSPSRSPR